MTDFVRVEGGRFYVGDRPYSFVGANLWYALSLASGGAGGDRGRLARELDRLQALGVGNLRVLAGTEGPEGEPYRVVPPLQPRLGEYDEAQLDGLDFLVAELGRRGLRAVVCLTNFWFWSGGLAQYLAWRGAGPIPYPLDPGGSWQRFQEFTAGFYRHRDAMDDLERHILTILERRNRYTGRRYVDEPAIMAWELANEPRGLSEAPAMRAWINRSAALIKSVDRHHLVTTGCEGDTDSPQLYGVDFVEDHRSPLIDYATVHLWVQNWQWYDPREGEPSYRRAEALALAYLRRHLGRAREELGKPVVLEEFGIARDGGLHDPAAATSVRDRYFDRLFALVVESVRGGDPLQGANFWAWAGEGRPRERGGAPWRPGDGWIGDPPHEPQGWYSVYDSDLETLAVIRRHVRQLGQVKGRR